MLSAKEKRCTEGCQADQNDYSLFDLGYRGNLGSLYYSGFILSQIVIIISSLFYLKR